MSFMSRIVPSSNKSYLNEYDINGPGIFST